MFYLKKKVLTFGIGLVAAVMLAGCQSNATVSTEKDKISVQSSYSKEYASDIAYVSLNISNLGKTKEEAELAVNEAVLALKEESKALGLKNENFETSNVHGYELKNPYRSTMEPFEEGYNYSMTLKVEISNLEKLNGFVDISNKIDNVNMSNIQYDLKDKAKAEDEVLEEAIKMAEEKASRAAGHLGVNIDKVHELKVQDSGTYSTFAREEAMVMSNSMGDSVSADINPQKVVIQTNIDASFSIK